jgi:two-component system cell cycle response regulator
VNLPKAQDTVQLSELRLDHARMLLEQAGSSLGEDALDAAQVVQNIVDGLCELSLRDPLTGLANRRQFNAVIEREIDRVARSGESALLMLLDLDHFKQVNDVYGHSAGDLVLQTVALRLMQAVRPMDSVARIGGEEFAVILPNCQAAFGRLVAERIRRMVEGDSITVAPGVQVKVTVSLGGAFAPQWIRSTAALWVERADRQLYKAKLDGRNRVNMEELLLSSVSAEEKDLLFGTLSAELADVLLGPAADGVRQ